MKMCLEKRLDTLERSAPRGNKPWRTIYIHPREGETEEGQKAALIASGEANEDDNFIVVTYVAPPDWSKR